MQKRTVLFIGSMSLIKSTIKVPRMEQNKTKIIGLKSSFDKAEKYFYKNMNDLTLSQRRNSKLNLPGRTPNIDIPRSSCSSSQTGSASSLEQSPFRSSVGTQTPTEHLSFLFPSSGYDTKGIDAAGCSSSPLSIAGSRYRNDLSADFHQSSSWFRSVQGSISSSGGVSSKEFLPDLIPSPIDTTRYMFNYSRSFDSRFGEIGQQLRGIADDYDKERLTRRRSFSMGQRKRRDSM